MSARATSPNDSPPATRWRLWIDGCGGFLLLPQSYVTVGGYGEGERADIRVRADFPRIAGTIRRAGGDYFWHAGEQMDDGQLVASDQRLAIPGSATITLRRPSPLSGTAVLEVAAPHRIGGHVDGVVLIEETMLIGPESDCHIRCPRSETRAVLTHRDNRWRGKVGLASDFREIVPGQATTLGTLTMLLEQA